MQNIILCVLFGTLIGWLGSLFARTATNEGILIDMLVGALGALILALLLANNSAFDFLAAGFLGASLALVLLYFARSQVRPR